MLNRLRQKINSIDGLDYIIIAFFFIGIFSFLLFTGTINSGYHLIDDHGILKIHNSLSNGNYLKTCFEYIANDLGIRFRPAYYMYYVTVIKTFGPNFIFISIFTGILAFLSFSLFYQGMRRLVHSTLLSIIFVLLIFVGPQAAVWWRLGTNETVGMFFLGLSFLYLTKETGKNYKLNNYIFSVFLIIMSLCKESFIIIVPSFIIFKIWIEKYRYDIKFMKSLLNNLVLVIPLLAVFIETLIIVFYVGTNQIGYAGISPSANDFLWGIRKILTNQLSLRNWIILLTVLISINLLSLLFNKTKNKKEFSNAMELMAMYLSFSLLVIIPSLCLYAKSGMFERYLLPTTFGLALIVVMVLKNTNQKILKALAFLFTALFIINSFGIAINGAKGFSLVGKRENILLSTVKSNATSKSKVLLVVDPVDRYEVTYSIETYLSYYGYNNFFVYPIMREYVSSFELNLKQQWLKRFDKKRYIETDGQPDLIILFDNKQTETFFSFSKILKENYIHSVPANTQYSIYKKK